MLVLLFCVKVLFFCCTPGTYCVNYTIDTDLTQISLCLQYAFKSQLNFIFWLFFRTNQGFFLFPPKNKRNTYMSRLFLKLFLIFSIIFKKLPDFPLFDILFSIDYNAFCGPKLPNSTQPSTAQCTNRHWSTDSLLSFY